MRSPSFVLLIAVLCLAVGANAHLSSKPACWYEEWQEGGSGKFALQKFLLWSLESSQVATQPVAQMHNYISPAAYNHKQPTEFPAGSVPYFYSMALDSEIALQSHGIAWVLQGEVGRASLAFLASEDNRCLNKFPNKCNIAFPGFCDNGDFCPATLCNPVTEMCEMSQHTRCASRPDGRAHCLETEARCVACERDSDCVTPDTSTGWCAGPLPTCDLGLGNCRRSRGGPCDHSPHGCSEEFKLCHECTVDTDCVDRAPAGEFCSTSLQCTQGFCVSQTNQSPCASTELCDELRRECRAPEISDDDDSQPLIVGIQENEETGECIRDSDCWDRPGEEYKWCEGGAPYCALATRTCEQRLPPTCECDVEEDTCHDCKSDEDCISHSSWCSPRYCEKRTHKCRVAQTPCDVSRVCVEDHQFCALQTCMNDTQCPNATFCGGSYACDTNSSMCYVVPGTVPCQQGLQGCNEGDQVCTPIDTQYLVAFIVLGVLALILLVLLVCCVCQYNNLDDDSDNRGQRRKTRVY